jgi:hypothetical protein
VLDRRRRAVSSFVLPANPHARAHSAYGETSIAPRPNGLTLPGEVGLVGGSVVRATAGSRTVELVRRSWQLERRAINLSVSGVTLSPEDFALLEEATLLAEEDELPLPPGLARARRRRTKRVALPA